MNGGLTAAQRRADRVAELAEVDLADADRVQPVLPARAAPAGLGAGAGVHVVDDDLADLVDDRSIGGASPSQDHLGGLLDVERDADGPGEVVAGPEREQAEARRSSGRCAGSSAATTACRLPSPPATTIRREPARCSTPSSSPGLDVGLHLDGACCDGAPASAVCKRLLVAPCRRRCW